MDSQKERDLKNLTTEMIINASLSLVILMPFFKLGIGAPSRLLTFLPNLYIWTLNKRHVAKVSTVHIISCFQQLSAALVDQKFSSPSTYLKTASMDCPDHKTVSHLLRVLYLVLTYRVGFCAFTRSLFPPTS